MVMPLQAKFRISTSRMPILVRIAIIAFQLFWKPPLTGQLAGLYAPKGAPLIASADEAVIRIKEEGQNLFTQ